jgi:glycosyltransferase involved in cell wall biosynthesis
MPRGQGAFWYEYETHPEFELAFTTPAQDIWGYASKFPDKVHFIPHMLDVRYFRDYRPPEGQGPVERDSVLAVMANNNWRKRFDYAIQFIHDVPWRKWRFLINNNQFFRIGEMLYSLRFLPGPHEVKDVWYGPVQDTRPFYAEAKALINPTTGEAFSMPIAEALAAGVPHVIATDLPELRELYGNALHYVDGRLVLMPDGSVQVLPDYHHFLWALKRALSDELPAKDHSVVEKYDVQNVLPKWKELLGL